MFLLENQLYCALNTLNLTNLEENSFDEEIQIWIFCHRIKAPLFYEEVGAFILFSITLRMKLFLLISGNALKKNKEKSLCALPKTLDSTMAVNSEISNCLYLSLHA